MSADHVFKALADPTRRLLLDRLHERNGQTLGELCERLDMARQFATQHLDILVRASLVTVVRRGRERLHYLIPAPGWPAVLANLKSLLETGEILPQAPWEMSPAHA